MFPARRISRPRIFSPTGPWLSAAGLFHGHEWLVNPPTDRPIARDGWPKQQAPAQQDPSKKFEKVELSLAAQRLATTGKHRPRGGSRSGPKRLAFGVGGTARTTAEQAARLGGACHSAIRRVDGDGQTLQAFAGRTHPPTHPPARPPTVAVRESGKRLPARVESTTMQPPDAAAAAARWRLRRV